MKRSPTSVHVLLVEDDESLRRVLAIELGRMGHRVEIRSDATALPKLLQQAAFDVVLLDLHLPGLGGMEVLTQLSQLEPDLPVVVCTGHGTVALAVEAMHRGAFDFLTKPVALDVLAQTIQRAATHGALLRENERLRRAAQSVVAAPVAPASPAARKLEQQVQRIGRADQGVLISGESGSGKELVARQLHAASARAQHPFVVLHCGAVPRQLIESELFGHTKGAFTGADQRRSGLFEAANGGTLFLDEVGELPIELQPALLRAVQFGEIRPVGSDEVRRVDVRVLAATHRDLRARVQEGAFREDLYYRLAVLEVVVPPLRDRIEDIPALATAFLAREGQRAGRPLAFDDAALQRLVQHSWPGNVRELENAIVRIGVLADGPVVTAGDVDELVFGNRAPAIAGLPTLMLPALERLAIEAAMKRFGGNKPKAAAALGIALKTLYNKLNAYDTGKDDGGGPGSGSEPARE